MDHHNLIDIEMMIFKIIEIPNAPKYLYEPHPALFLLSFRNFGIMNSLCGWMFCKIHCLISPLNISISDFCPERGKSQFVDLIFKFYIFSIWPSMINSCWKNLDYIGSDNFGAKRFHWFMIWPNSIDDIILWCNYCTNWYFERGPCKQFVWRQYSKLAFTAARPSMTW
jgi:hypothetical protein